MSTELHRKIGFSQIKGLNSGQATKLLGLIGGVDKFFDLSTRKLWDSIGSQKSWCTDASRDALLEIGRGEQKFLEHHSGRAIFVEDEDYPRRLRECEDGPTMLYQIGCADLNARHVVGIVGTRRATVYGQRMTEELVDGLASKLDGLVIVSGLAYGIDVAAHKASLKAGVPTVGVVAHGLKTIYPADHRDVAARMIKSGGGIVTEYVSDAPVYRGNFLARNRIVAGLSDVTVVIESEEKGGAMVTASIAFDYNREVGCMPGRVTDRYSAGPLKLIRSHKGSLIRNADDLIELMGWEAKTTGLAQPELPFDSRPKPTGEKQRRITEYLRSHENSTINEMVEALGMPYAELSSQLMELEMNDVVVALPGAAYQMR